MASEKMYINKISFDLIMNTFTLEDNNRITVNNEMAIIKNFSQSLIVTPSIINFTNHSNLDERKDFVFDRLDVRVIFITLYSLVFCCCFFGKTI